jgi:hypothetical protein
VYRTPSSGLAKRLVGLLLAGSPGASFDVLGTSFRSPSLFAISRTSMARIHREPVHPWGASRSLLTKSCDRDCRLGGLS